MRKEYLDKIGSRSVRKEELGMYFRGSENRLQLHFSRCTGELFTFFFGNVARYEMDKSGKSLEFLTHLIGMKCYFFSERIPGTL